VTGGVKVAAKGDAGAFARAMRAIGEEGARRHSTWDRDAFAAFEPIARQVWEATGDLELTAAYLEMVREGIALHLLRAPSPERPATLLEACIGARTLEALQTAALTRREALALLAATWNLSEGLAKEPEWMQSYVLSRRAELTALRDLPAFLVRVLAPVLSPPPASTFEKDLAVCVLDTRAADDEFLPGDLTLVAPTVLAVRDRRRPIELGVFLEHGRASAILGPMDGARPFTATAPKEVHLAGSTLHLGDASIELPHLVSPRAYAIAPAGFVAITAEDSQRLWIVESR
jgi:hypothetical protein